MSPACRGIPAAGRWLAAGLMMALLVGGPAAAAPPDLQEGDLEALQAHLASARGRPVLVSFWATWCLPCLKEFPSLNELQERLAPEGLELLAVSLDHFVYPDAEEAREKVRRATVERSLALPGFLYLGDQEALFAAFDLPPGLPHTLLLGRDGEVLDRVEGQLESAEVERLTRRVREILAD